MTEIPAEPRKSALASWISSLLVVGGLAAIGWWGHTHHWQFGASQHPATHEAATEGTLTTSEQLPSPAAETVSVAGQPDLKLPEIEFSSAETARECGIVVGPVTRGEMDEVVVANGVVGYDQTRVAQLSLRVAGSVWRVERHLGDQVNRGDALVIVDSAAVGEAKANLLEACVVYRLKTQHLQRISQIKDAVAGREIIELEAACELAQTQRFNALQKLTNLGFSLKLAEIESLSADDLSRKLHLLGLPAGLEDPPASDNLIPLLAPFSGVVTKCDVVRGESVEPAVPFYVIADTSRKWIHLNIRQDDASRIKVGDPVIFEGDMRTPPVEARLTWIGTEIDSRTRTIQARAEVENPELDDDAAPAHRRRLLSAGAFGTARIVIARHADVVLIPDEALHWQWELGREVVFVTDKEGRVYSPRFVTKGLMREGQVQIASGLQPGDELVVSGGRILAAELSEHLQGQVGENAGAARIFHHAHDDPEPAP